MTEEILLPRLDYLKQAALLLKDRAFVQICSGSVCGPVSAWRLARDLFKAA